MAQSRFASGWRSVALRTILPVIVTFCLVAGGTCFVVMPILEEHLMAGKREMIRELTNAVCQLLADYDQRVASGELTLEEAQSRAKLRVGAIRYGEDLSDYFWMTDSSIVMLVHPHRPDTVGHDMHSFVDASGKSLFVDMDAVVKETGEGYVEYLWPSKDNPDKMVPKLTFAKSFEPWQWIVGTGVYLDDVHIAMSDTTRRLATVLAVILGIVAVLSAHIVWQGLRSENRRLAAERALRDSERRLKDIVEFLPDATLVIDRDGRITAWNKAMETLTGRPASEMVGQGEYAYA